MTSTKIQNVAFFKVRSTNSIPLRPGPVQCIRNCTNCIMRTNNETTVESEELISIMSFDNLVTRKSLLLFKYQSLQYHVGQMELLIGSLKLGAPLTIYIAATTSVKDLNFINMIFDHAQVPNPHLINTQITTSDVVAILKTKKTIVIPIQLRSCHTSSKFPFQFTRDEPCFGARQLMALLEPCIKLVLDDQNFDLNIVPVTITKDHDNLTLFGVGSVCVEISEPYKLSAYLKGKQTSQKSTHLVQHIYYDAAHSVAILSSHLVAFLILYLERENGLEISTLVEYIDWFRLVSIDTGMHLGFTGSSHKAVEFALLILGKFVKFSSAKYYLARNIESLMDYADLVVPMIAYYGLIAKAILIEYNRGKPVDAQLGHLEYGIRIRVTRDKVIETSKLLAEKLEHRVPCRRPCTTIERCVEDTICQMEGFGRYFKIEEPQISMVSRARRWAGDSDDEADDDAYFRRNRDNPAFKCWILLSERDYRRDRLNLFLNAINLHLLQ